ncbi:hypothetical protein RHGRI_008920 [Rhododendron griersonianum]|uniref:Uncharacterized protein n=1 Tax=Rhododendron griersonianum TaxID=479676 RepID=A0AAV6L2D4_9ERIC|nr:hypothetical protein RHGRI_008920 [Rhododendron griersonianum]
MSQGILIGKSASLAVGVGVGPIEEKCQALATRVAPLITYAFGIVGRVRENKGKRQVRNSLLPPNDNKLDLLHVTDATEAHGLRDVELVKSVSDKPFDLLRPSARHHSLFKAQARNTADPEKGKYTLIRDAEDFQPGTLDKPLPCFGCGIGWFSLSVSQIRHHLHTPLCPSTKAKGKLKWEREITYAFGIVGRVRENKGKRQVRNSLLPPNDNKLDLLHVTDATEAHGLRDVELVKSVSDKPFDLLRPSARHHSLFKAQARNTADPEKGKYTLIRDAEDFQPGTLDKPLPCFGCGIGWFS